MVNHATSLRRACIAISLLVLATAAGLTLGAEPARALCAVAPEEGTWVNLNTNTRGLTRVVLKACQPITQCSGNVCTITYDAGWLMRVYGKCSPTDCDWGPVTAQQFANRQIRGYYNQGFAKRYVHAWLPTPQSSKLIVRWRTDFVDPSRTDYQRQEYFKKV